MIEKLLFSKIEAWVVVLFFIFGSVGAVFLGYFAQARVTGDERFGWVGNKALAVAQLPDLVGRVIRLELDEHEVEGRFAGDGGFQFVPDFASSHYVLLSRYDGDAHANTLELFSEGAAVPLHRWDFADSALYEYEPRNRFQNDIRSSAPYTLRAHHPLITGDGNLFVHFGTGSPLYRLDECSDLVWRNEDFAYHHSLEQDGDGNFWSPGKASTELTEEGFDERYHDDFVVQISPDGETLFAKSLTEILIENGLINRVLTYDHYHPDPIHLNDVEPVLQDGPHWKRGDVFLSLGHLNMIMLYRPAENALLWWSQDRIMHQHDIDIVDQSRISVFDNRRTDRADGETVLGHNEILIFDLADGSVTPQWQDSFRDLEIRTINQGLSDFIPGSGLLVEEPNYGRLVKLGPDSALQWTYVNKNNTGKTYTLNWSRYIAAPLGDQIMQSLERRQCDA